MIAKLIKIKAAIAIITLAICLSITNLICSYLFISGPLKESKIIIINKGASITRISNILNEEGILRYPKLFKLITCLYARDIFLKSGEYEFTPYIKPMQILQKLVKGQSVVHRIKINEGSMVSEIIEQINIEDKLIGKITTTLREGFLLPSTYHYSRNDAKDKLVNKMIQLMSKALDDAMKQLDPRSPIKTRMEVLTLASIIEKEAANDFERPMISGVFINRIKKGMKLQADPTSAYAVTKGKYRLRRALTRTDLRTASPYNTYYAYGLPPGPICCPSKKSIMAAARPAATEALFFVVGENGSHVFSRSLNEHNKHVNNYRQNISKNYKYN